jgi:hypothetical protein
MISALSGDAAADDARLDAPRFVYTSGFARRQQDSGRLSALSHKLGYDSGAIYDHTGWILQTGFVNVVYTTPGNSSVTSAPANLGLGAYWQPLETGSLTGQVGAGLAFHLGRFAAHGEPRLQRAAKLQAFAMSGASEAWLWSPGTTALTVPASLRFVGTSPWGGSFGLKATAAWSRVFGANYEDPVSTFVPFELDVSAQTLSRVWVGTSGQLVWMPGAPYDDVQMAVAPHLELRWTKWLLGLGCLLNLDGPYGFGAYGNHTWALRLYFGFLG